MSDDAPTPETLRVLVGDPTDDEIAALLTVLAARAAAGSGDRQPATPTSHWAAHWRAAGARQPSGPDGWRTSGLPR